MPTLTETFHRGHFIYSEANRTLSREAVTIAQSVSLVSGTVLGMVTATGKYKILAPTQTDGTQNAAALLFDNVDCSLADVPGSVVIVRQAEVTGSELTWPVGITAPQQAAAIAALRTLGIVVRS